MTIQFGTRNNYEWDINQRKLSLFHKEYSIERITSKYLMISTIFISIGYIIKEQIKRNQINTFHGTILHAKIFVIQI